jgi:hypothetical protein
LAASVLPGGTGSVLLGLSTAAQATNDALDRGVAKTSIPEWSGSGDIREIFEKWLIGNFVCVGDYITVRPCSL